MELIRLRGHSGTLMLAQMLADHDPFCVDNRQGNGPKAVVSGRNQCACMLGYIEEQIRVLLHALPRP
jgi:hypothetical protein